MISKRFGNNRLKTEAIVRVVLMFEQKGIKRDVPS